MSDPAAGEPGTGVERATVGTGRKSDDAARVAKPLQFYRPERGPTRLELDNAQGWRAFQERGVEAVRASATKWRDGLAALVTVITGGVVLGGPSAVAKLAEPWKFVVAGLVFTGYAAALFGLWFALRASAGLPVKVALSSFSGSGQPLWEHELRRAIADTSRLAVARGAVVVALLCLWAGSLVWWLSPAATAQAPDRVVLRGSDDVVCGRLLRMDDAGIRIEVERGQRVRVFPAEAVESVRVGGCR